MRSLSKVQRSLLFSIFCSLVPALIFPQGIWAQEKARNLTPSEISKVKRNILSCSSPVGKNEIPYEREEAHLRRIVVTSSSVSKPDPKKSVPLKVEPNSYIYSEELWEMVVTASNKLQQNSWVLRRGAPYELVKERTAPPANFCESLDSDSICMFSSKEDAVWTQIKKSLLLTTKAPSEKKLCIYASHYHLLKALFENGYSYDKKTGWQIGNKAGPLTPAASERARTLTPSGVEPITAP